MHSVIIRCVVVDDEPLAIEKLEAYIAKVPFLKLEKSFSNGLEALDFLKTNVVELLFLDVQMDEITGIQLLEIMKIRPQVILTTAYDQFALKGYELEVSDYLLKPISFNRFLQAVTRIHDRLSVKASEKQSSLPKSTEENVQNESGFIFVKTEYRMQRVVLNEIHYIEGMKDYLRIVTPAERVMTLTNFKNMLEMLPGSNFCRIHKSYVINVSKIQSIERGSVLVLNERIPIGDSFRSDFFALLERMKLINPKQI